MTVDGQKGRALDVPTMSRRMLLKASGAGALLLATAPPVSACDSASGSGPVLLNGRRLDASLTLKAAEIANLCAGENLAFLQSKYDTKSELITDFGPFDEWHIRKPCTIAFGIAALIKLDVYDESTAGVPRSNAVTQVTRLIKSLTAKHVSQHPDGWGGRPGPWSYDASHNDWQGALWCHFVSHGAWLVWKEFSAAERASIVKMVVYEADRFLTFTVPYWRDRTGNTHYEGDTKAEESAWNASMLATALIMLPDHQHAAGWMAKFVELSTSVGSVPADTASADRIHGEIVGEIVSGSNLTGDGIVVNHGYPNPRYSAALAQNWLNGVLFAHEDYPIPACTLRQGDLIYRAMADFKFAAPPWQSPGGSYYVTDSPRIYYPANPENYGQQMAPFAAMDSLAHILRLDTTSSVPAATWAGLHVEEFHRQTSSSITFRSEWALYHAVWLLLAAFSRPEVMKVTTASITSLSEALRSRSCNGTAGQG
ncbi:hypothetical protein [Mycolicibacterium neoaurum]|uniref:hypothetical protein n=1 Tax=Mycolicibacterium neoaurum TaxID=1795 RepID=UPI000B28E6B5|nr:hypothetical protein [Mycolicibacterium neoaurum]